MSTFPHEGAPERAAAAWVGQTHRVQNNSTKDGQLEGTRPLTDSFPQASLRPWLGAIFSQESGLSGGPSGERATGSPVVQGLPPFTWRIVPTAGMDVPNRGPESPGGVMLPERRCKLERSGAHRPDLFEFFWRHRPGVPWKIPICLVWSSSLTPLFSLPEDLFGPHSVARNTTLTRLRFSQEQRTKTATLRQAMESTAYHNQTGHGQKNR